MANRSKTSTVFSPPEIKRLHKRLAKRTITAFWEVGRILNQRFDTRPNKRAPFGGLEKIAAALKACGGNAPISLSQLHQCRLLYETWGRKDVKAAERVRLPWSRAIAMLSVWSSATEKKWKEQVLKCRRLVEKYPGHDREKLKHWMVELKAVQKTDRGKNLSKPANRHLLEKKKAAIYRLRAVAQIIDEMQEFVPAGAQPGFLGLKTQAEGLIELVSVLCEKHTAPRS